MLDESLEMVKDTFPVLDDDSSPENEGGIRLFKHAPPGIIFDPIGMFLLAKLCCSSFFY